MNPSLRPAEPKVQLPHVEPLGYVKLNFVKAYVRGGGGMLNAHRDTGGDPVLYIDLEHSPHGTELHLGVSGNFSVSPERPSSVKPHIDIYIPQSQIHKFLQSIILANLRRSDRHQAPVGPTRPHYPPTFRESAEGTASGQRETSAKPVCLKRNVLPCVPAVAESGDRGAVCLNSTLARETSDQRARSGGESGEGGCPHSPETSFKQSAPAQPAAAPQARRGGG